MSQIDRKGSRCCQSVELQTPAQIDNPPGLRAISYRVGTYPQFKQSMQARLADPDVAGVNRLKAQVRGEDDFTVALLDTWAMVADVLTFYQERIANEAYRRTATEQPSLLELSRMVKYELKPGVAADTYLAFTLEDAPGSPDKVTISIGTKVQSLPNPGEEPQVFETIEEIEARARWNAIKPVATQAQKIFSKTHSIVLKGTSSNLRPGDAILIVDDATPATGKLYWIKAVKVDRDLQQTHVFIEDYQPMSPVEPGASAPERVAPKSSDAALRIPSPVEPGASAAGKEGPFGKRLPLTNDNVKGLLRDTAPMKSLETLALVQGWRLDTMLANVAAQAARPSPVKHSIAPARTGGSEEEQNGEELKDPHVFVLRARASLFGHNAPDWNAMPDQVRTSYFERYKKEAREKGLHEEKRHPRDFADWPFIPLWPATTESAGGAQASSQDSQRTPRPRPLAPRSRAGEAEASSQDSQSQLDLDRVYPQLLPDSWTAIIRPGQVPVIAQVKSVKETGAVGYTLSAKVTRLELRTSEGEKPMPEKMEDIRQTTVYTQSEELCLAEVPVPPLEGNKILVQGGLEGLHSDHLLIVSGERLDLSGSISNERVTLEEATVNSSNQSKLRLKAPLLYQYKPDTVTLNANIAKATQGETVQDEILGSGDASQPYQKFTLRQYPLTYIQAATHTGRKSTLRVFVDDIEWQEVDTLYERRPDERVFVTHIDEDGKVTIQFGDGHNGARLPTGESNVRASYRKGSGKQGLVQPGQLSLLQTRPPGVKGVTNPDAPIGAIDPETTEDARRQATNTVLTLGRAVTERDYEDFARSYAGVAKARATRIWTQQRHCIVVTVAGPPTLSQPAGTFIEQATPLYNKIYSGMRLASDPAIPFTLQSYMPRVFALKAKVKIDPADPDAVAEDVLKAVKQAVRTAFSFEKRAFGQPVTLNEILAVIQAVPKVVTVRIEDWYIREMRPQEMLPQESTGEHALNNVHKEDWSIRETLLVPSNSTEPAEVLAAALPQAQPDGSITLAELLIVDPVCPFDSLVDWK